MGVLTMTLPGFEQTDELARIAHGDCRVVGMAVVPVYARKASCGGGGRGMRNSALSPCARMRSAYNEKTGSAVNAPGQVGTILLHYCEFAPAGFPNSFAGASYFRKNLRSTTATTSPAATATRKSIRMAIEAFTSFTLTKSLGE